MRSEGFAAKPEFFVEADCFLQDAGRFQFDVCEASLFCFGQCSIEHDSSVAVPARRRAQIHLAKFAGGVIHSAQACRSDNRTVLVKPDAEPAASFEIGAFQIAQVDIDTFGLRRQSVFSEDVEYEFLHGSAIGIRRDAVLK